MGNQALEAFIIEEFGKRCPDFSAGCVLCEVWAACDALIARVGTLSGEDADMAMHWLDRYAAGIDSYPQFDRIGEECPTCGHGDLPRGVTICPTCDAEWPEDE